MTLCGSSTTAEVTACLWSLADQAVTIAVLSIMGFVFFVWFYLFIAHILKVRKF